MNWVEHKLDLFSSNLERFATPDIRTAVMAGSESLASESNPETLTTWMEGAVKRLLSLVDNETAVKILTHNACRFREETFLGDTVGALERLRAAHLAGADIPHLIQLMASDRSGMDGGSIFPVFTFADGVIHNTKEPCRPEEYATAPDQYSKQKAYCYCPFARFTRGDMPAEYCYCGAGFTLYIWEEILGRELRVEVLESIITGGERCRFAIYTD